MEIAGRTALVTGASGGLGQAIARELHARGAKLVLSARREDVLRALAAELSARVELCDLADTTSVEALVESAGGADVLVANAGLEAAEDLVDIPAAAIERAVAVNLCAPAVLAAGMGRLMAARGSGHVVFVSSMAGKVATAGNGSLYTATKWGLRGLGLGLRDELRTAGVGVSTIFPGPIRDAGMFADAGTELPRSFSTSAPADVAHAVCRAIEQDVGEIDVAAPLVRLGGKLGGIAPGLVARTARRQGVERVRRDLIAARR